MVDDMGFDGNEILEHEKQMIARKLKQEANEEKKRRGYLPGWFVALAFGFIALFIYAQIDSGGGTNKSAIAPGQHNITKEHHFGCKSREVYDRLGLIVAQGDREAFSKGLTAALEINECVRFKIGDTVFIEDTSIFSGSVKVRPQGELNGYWVPIEAISR